VGPQALLHVNVVQVLHHVRVPPEPIGACGPI
jgi:hypothetical protein